MVKATIDRSAALNVCENFIKAFESWCVPSKAPSLNEIEKYCAKNFHITRNGHVFATSPATYLTAVEGVRKTYAKGCKMSAIIGTPVVSENSVALTFSPVFTDANGQKVTYLITAVATVENGKIAQWNEVAHKTHA